MNIRSQSIRVRAEAEVCDNKHKKLESHDYSTSPKMLSGFERMCMGEKLISYFLAEPRIGGKVKWRM